ncbi:MAG: cytochrome c [Gemmatimonadota bacterium]
MDLRKLGFGATALCAAATLMLAGCAPQDGGTAGDDTAAVVSPAPPAALASGRDLFDAHCAECHGPAASGTTQGPPLVHDIYRPGHHADVSFHLAVQRGSRAHHWNFGDMQPLPGVPADRVQEIVDYVRWLQREAGVR